MPAIDTRHVNGPHRGCEVFVEGTPIAEARLAVVLLHGRGGSAREILTLREVLTQPGVEGVAFVAPQAAGNSWYPKSFLAPIDENAEHLGSSHETIAAVLGSLRAGGLGAERVALVGFSQGACLASDHCARFPARYAFVGAMTGGLIGPLGTTFEFTGSLDGTPVFLGASDPDSHVPWSRVEETARVMDTLGGVVTLERYPGMPHTITREHIRRVREMIADAAGSDAT